MAKVLVRKRGASWQYRFEIAPVNGQRKEKSKSGFATKADALAAGTKALAEYNNAGVTHNPADISVSDYLDFWLEKSVQATLKHNTYLAYKSVVDNHIKKKYGAYRLRALTPAAFAGWGAELTLQGYARAHVVGIMSTMHAALDYAVAVMQYIHTNPMASVKYPRKTQADAKKKQEKIILSDNEWGAILDRFPAGNRFYIPLMIGYYTGCRVGEVMGITWDNVDLTAKTITIARQLVRRDAGKEQRTAKKYGSATGRAKWYLASTKTISSIRLIPIGDTLADVLRQEKKRQIANRLHYGQYYENHYCQKEIADNGEEMLQIISSPASVQIALSPLDFVCVDENGALTTADSMKYCSRVIRNELKIPFGYHCLRHTHATLLIEGGANVKSVQARLGHGNINTTLQTYAHNTDTMAAESVRIFEARNNNSAVK